MPLPSETHYYTITGDGNTTTYTIPQEIISSDDIKIYNQGTLVTNWTLAISSDTEYVLTFSAAIVSGVVYTIVRNSIARNPNLLPIGSPLTSQDINRKFNESYLNRLDSNYKFNNFSHSYYSYTNSSLPTSGMLNFPLPLGQPSGEYSVFGWNGIAWESIPLTDGNLEVRLASTSDPQGASLIGYNNGAATTVKAQLDLLIQLLQVSTSISTGGATHIEAWLDGAANSLQGIIDIYTNTAATSSTASGAANITYWNGAASTSVQAQVDINKTDILAFGAAATSSIASGAYKISLWNLGSNTDIQTWVDSLFAAATATNTGAAMNMFVWDSSDGGNSLSIGVAITQLYGTPSASNTELGAGWVNYWNGTASVTVKSKLDNSREYRIGDFMAGVPTEPYPSGSWLQCNATHSIGSDSSGATHASNDYEALYIYIRENYLGETNTAASAAWTANTPITPSTLASNQVPGSNAWRYA